MIKFSRTHLRHAKRYGVVEEEAKKLFDDAVSKGLSMKLDNTVSVINAIYLHSIRKLR